MYMRNVDGCTYIVIDHLVTWYLMQMCIRDLCWVKRLSETSNLKVKYELHAFAPQDKICCIYICIYILKNWVLIIWVFKLEEFVYPFFIYYKISTLNYCIITNFHRYQRTIRPFNWCSMNNPNLVNQSAITSAYCRKFVYTEKLRTPN